jgi:DNA transposition AAA+ family ATPase
MTDGMFDETGPDLTTEEDRLKGRISEIQNFIDLKGISQNKFGQMAGVSSSVVSQVLSGSYLGDKDAAIAKMMDVVERERTKERISLKRPDFQATSIYKNIMYSLEIAQSDKMITVIVGDAGLGKTMALDFYTHEHPSTTSLIRVNPTYKDATILKAIADSLGLQNTGRKDVLFDEIVAKLRGTGRMIIVDEADYLNVKALDVLRRIHDEAEVPVVLIGLEKLKKMISSVSEKYRQIFSRMFAVKLPQLTLDDTRMITGNVLDASESIIAHLHKVAQGNARKLVNLIIRTQRLMSLNNKGLDIGIINEAAAALL